VLGILPIVLSKAMFIGSKSSFAGTPISTDWRHPAEMGNVEIEAYLSYLATERHVSASMQNQAISALLFQ